MGAWWRDEGDARPSSPRCRQLLDASLAGATEHLRAIVTPARTLDAQELCDLLTGMRTLAVSTVTATGEPRVSGVDGHFLHGRWVFTTSGTAAKARHLRARPAVSAAHLVGDDLGVFCHGRARVPTARGPRLGADRGPPDRPLRQLAHDLGP